MMTEKIVRYDSPEAATFREGLRGWVSRHGHFYGDTPDSEHLARYDGCTHTICKSCGKPGSKTYIECEDCRGSRRNDAWEKAEKEPWDGSVLCEYDGDKFYESPEDAIEDIMDGGESSPYSIRLVMCEPDYLTEIDPDEYFYDKLPEGMSLEDNRGLWPVLDAFKKLNEEIRALGGKVAVSYHAGKRCLDISPYAEEYLREQEENEASCGFCGQPNDGGGYGHNHLCSECHATHEGDDV